MEKTNMELVMNFITNNPGWTLLFIIFGSTGIANIIRAIRGVPAETLEDKDDEGND